MPLFREQARGYKTTEYVLNSVRAKNEWLCYGTAMSTTEIVAEIPRLSHEERREIMRRLIAAEEDAATLAECDRLALERFQMLDALEAEDEKNAAR